MKGFCPITALVGLLLAPLSSFSQDVAPARAGLLKGSLDKIPLHIIQNRGVYPETVRFYVQGKDKTVFFANGGITFSLRGKDRDWVVKLDFVDANDRVRVRGAERHAAVFSYFRGPREAWKTGLASFGQVVYEDLWPGIDLVYRAEVGALKDQFRVRPGADPGKIRLRYRGATSVKPTTKGALRVETPAAVFEDARPVAWVCEEDRSHAPVDVAYAVGQSTSEDEATVGFEVGTYRTDRELVIDPAVFVYCGFIGGGGRDQPKGVAVDLEGNAYVAGLTEGTSTFPVKVGPSLTYPGVMYAGFVAKVDCTGRNLVYCGYIGGRNNDWVTAIAVDSKGCAYLTGPAVSNETSFPVTVGPDLTYNGKGDCFVAKVNASGTGLDYCGYLGGYSGDRGTGIAVDASGCAYVTGITGSEDPSRSPPGTPFPTTVGPDTTYNGCGDVFVAKLDPTGTRWLYCGYIGGELDEYATGIAVDEKGCAYVVGNTKSSAFPVVVGPRITGWPGAQGDGFVAKVNASGTGLDYCGYIGGSAADELYGVAVDSAGHAYVAGWTLSPENTLPLLVGPGLKRGTSQWGDGLVAKVSQSGATLVYCGLISGDGGVASNGIAVDQNGHAYVAGATGSSAQTFPVREWPQVSMNGIVDAFVARIDTTGRFLHYCGYIGGAYYERATGIAVTPSGNAFVTGSTLSGEMSFPVTVGPDLTHNLGGEDGFIAKVKFTDIIPSGSAQIGQTVTFHLAATDSAGLPYQVGSSLDAGPIALGNRQIDLSPDDLLVVSVADLWPWIFSGYRGVIDSKGQALAAIHIPNVQALIGLRIHTAFVTIDPPSPWGIKSISSTETITITR